MLQPWELDVYKKAYALALEIHKVTDVFPKHELYGGLADQMRRASRSICANIMEGLGKNSAKPEQLRFLTISMGSLVEMKFWVPFSRDVGYLKSELADKWMNEYESCGKMLGALMQRRKS